MKAINKVKAMIAINIADIKIEITQNNNIIEANIKNKASKEHIEMFLHQNKELKEAEDYFTDLLTSLNK